ncbi:MAG: hypothetical protein K9N06_09295 [Candidatus Cloacimonetes bacterium]|nr:hypothetical protein [Candidatus Cloacimonadota bacterium]
MVLFLPLLLSAYNLFSPTWREEFRDSEHGREIKLTEKPVIKGSLTIIDDENILRDSIDYKVNYQEGIINLSDDFGSLRIAYAIFPQELQKRFLNYEIIKTGKHDSIAVNRRRKSREAYEPLQLQVKGNKTISISVSDDEAFQLDQTLFLQINGELGDNVNIQAQVNDSASPLTPEGDSRELSNLDRIFIRIYGEQYDLGFGDLEHSFKNSYFLDFSPVFEGLKAGYGKQQELTAAAGLTRSESSSLEFKGIEGRQGPYWLSSEYNGEAVLVAGSERIYLNGIEMARGEDYTIDYAEGSIIFGDSHFIRSSDRIYAVYQYADENYRQTVYLGDGEYEIIEGLTLGTAIYYQKDDADNPLTAEFSAADLDSLAAGGDGNIWGSGEYETEAGLGAYYLNPAGYYEYVGYDSTGTWNVSFYETQNGDYIRSETGNYYIYAGSGDGDYLPGVRLTAPQAQGNYSLHSSYSRGEFEFNAEALYTSNDLNTKSNLDDEDNGSWAGRMELNWEKEADRIMPYAGVNWRWLGKNLYTFDPVSSAADFYETGAFADTLEQTEMGAFWGVNVHNIIKPEINLRWQQAGDVITQNYLRTDVRVYQQRYLPAIVYRYLSWTSSAADTVIYSRHTALISYNLHNWKPGYELIREKREGGYFPQENRRDQVFLEFNRQENSGRIYWETSAEDSLFAVEKIYSETAGLKLHLRTERQEVKLNLAHRQVRDSTVTRYDLGEIGYNGKIGETFNVITHYRVRNLDFYPRIRELVYVGDGEGQYNEAGEEEPEGDYDWKIVAIDYDRSQESVEVTANATLNVNPGNGYPDLLQRMNLTLESAVTEQSTTKDLRALYLLDGSEIMQPENTVYGIRNWKGNWWYDLLRNRLSLRLTADEEERLDNRYQDGEKLNRQRQEAYLRWKYSRKLGYEIYVEQRREDDSRYKLQSESREIALEVKYTPESSLVYNCRGAVGSENDEDSSGDYDYTLQKMEIIPSVNWYPRKGSRLFGRFKFRYNLAEGVQYASWQKEDRAGSVFTWDISYDYQINKYVSMSLDYKGEKYPEVETHHEFRMEVSAEF